MMDNLAKFYDKLYTWILTVGPRFIIAVGVLFFGWWIIRIIKRALNRHMASKEFDPSLQPFLVSLLITGLQVLLILALMQILGLQMTIFTALIGAFGVAAGLALSGTLQNFTSGILILLLKPFRVGDNIIAQGQEGTVTQIRIFYTVVLTYHNTTVIIPNSKLSNEVIVNLSREGRRRLDIEMKFAFPVAYEQVKGIVEETVDRTRDLLNDPPLRVGVSSVENDGYKVMINVWVEAHGFFDARLKFQEALVQNLKEAGIKLPGM